MAEIRIEWLSDSQNCETCGVSYAGGARVLIDGEQLGDFTPIAHCLTPASFWPTDVFKAILEHLGHSAVVVVEDSLNA